MKESLVAIMLAGLFILFSEKASSQSQIILSSRWFHPRGFGDTLNTLKTIEDFKVDRIDWMYCDNDAQLLSLRQRGVKYSLAINPQVPDSGLYTTSTLRIKDINGVPVVAPWMNRWKIQNPFWGCVNNPQFEALFISKTKRIVDLGAYGVVVDDARFNDHAFDWGGCYCDFCIAGFNDFLRSSKIALPSNFNYKLCKQTNLYPNGLRGSVLNTLYKQYQTKSVVLFLRNWRSVITKYAKRPFVFLTNNSGGKWNDIYKVFDVGIAEMPQNNTSLKLVDQILSDAKRNGKLQIFSFASESDLNNIAFFLYCYLNGATAIIPWDTFMNGGKSLPSPKRHFISRETILPVLNFVIENKEKFSSAISIDPLSIGIKTAPGNITLCKKFSDGETFLFSSPEVLNGKTNTTLYFSGPEEDTTHRSITTIVNSRIQKLLKSDIKILSGNYILLKL